MLLAAGLSLALHALLFLFLVRREAALPEALGPRPLVVEVLQRPSRRTQKPLPVKSTTPGQRHGTSEAQGPPPATGQRVGPAVADAPRVALDFFPEGALAAAMPPEPETPDAGSPAEVIGARVQGWRLAALAEHRVSVGVDSYFSTLAHALRDGLGTPPPPSGPSGPSLGQRVLKDWFANLAAPDAPEEEPKAERAPAQPQHDLDGREADMVHQLLGPMAATQASLMAPYALLRRSQAELPPAAVLRLVQDARGHLVHVELVASSGDAGFDAFVKHSAALALASVPKPPGQGAGLHPDGTRSEWAFYRAGEGVAVLLLRVY
jgi:TonB C terminal